MSLKQFSSHALWATIAVLATVGLAACTSGSVAPGAEFPLFDVPVTCDAKTGLCRSDAGDAVSGEYHRVRVRAHVWRRGDRATLRLDARVQRAGGARGRLALAVPFGVLSGETGPSPKLSYEETLAGQVAFSSQAASRRIELSADRACP